MALSLPECIEIKSVDELRKVRAVAVYSDGSPEFGMSAMEISDKDLN